MEIHYSKFFKYNHTGSKWSFQSDCCFDPKISAGQYPDQKNRMMALRPELGTASRSAPNDPTANRNMFKTIQSTNMNVLTPLR